MAAHPMEKRVSQPVRGRAGAVEQQRDRLTRSTVGGQKKGRSFRSAIWFSREPAYPPRDETTSHHSLRSHHAAQPRMQADPAPTTPAKSPTSPPPPPAEEASPHASAQPQELPYRSSANRSGPRSRAGCWTCREKKVKCDETRPVCQRCVRLRRQCDYKPRPRKPYTRKASSAHASSSSGAGAGAEAASHSSPSSSSSASSDHDVSSPPESSSQGSQIVLLSPRRSSRHDSAALVLPPLQHPEMAAACSVVFTPADHEAIYYYRTRFSTNHHTKNPDYSVFSLLFLQARRHAMPMHMILALADQELMWVRAPRPTIESANSPKSVARYTEALRLMTQAMSVADAELDLDQVLATLWLMMAYEQKYGDGEGIGLSKHLQGAASILRTRFRPLLQLSVDERPSTSSSSSGGQGSNSSSSQAVGPSATATEAQQGIISLFAARMVVWMAVLDSGAAFGVGANFGGSVNQLVRQIAGEDNVRLLKGFASIHQYSEPLFRTTWGESYPPSELLDDLENRKVYSLFAKSALIRYEISELSLLLHRADADAAAAAEAARRAQDIDNAFALVRDEFAELLELAARLSPDLDHSRRLVQNIRYVVPHYYAMELEFLRLTRFGEPALAPAQRRALHEIMNLAYQGYKHDGDRFLVRIPLPLLFAGLETDDLIHRAWIVERFDALAKFGKNYARACRALRVVLDEQMRRGERVDHMQLLAEGRFEQFVI